MAGLEPYRCALEHVPVAGGRLRYALQRSLDVAQGGLQQRTVIRPELRSPREFVVKVAQRLPEIAHGHPGRGTVRLTV